MTTLDYVKFDNIVGKTMGMMFSDAATNSYLALRKVDPDDDGAMAVFHIAAISASLAEVPFYVELNIINWIRLKWRARHARIRFKRTGYKHENEYPRACDYINKVCEESNGEYTYEDFQAIYREYYSREVVLAMRVAQD